jgi:hypothetical protein
MGFSLLRGQLQLSDEHEGTLQRRLPNLAIDRRRWAEEI